MSYEDYISKTFPFEVEHCGITIPLMGHERILAYDANGKLWAYQYAPRWSEASQKWIPVDEDTPRLIIIRLDGQVNAFYSICNYILDL